MSAFVFLTAKGADFASKEVARVAGVTGAVALGGRSTLCMSIIPLNRREVQ